MNTKKFIPYIVKLYLYLFITAEASVNNNVIKDSPQEKTEQPNAILSDAKQNNINKTTKITQDIAQHDPYLMAEKNELSKIYKMILIREISESERNIYVLSNMVYSVLLLVFAYSIYRFKSSITSNFKVQEDKIENAKMLGNVTVFVLILMGTKEFLLYFLTYNSDKNKYVFCEIFIDILTGKVDNSKNSRIVSGFMFSGAICVLITITLLMLRYPTESLSQILEKKKWDFENIVEKNIPGKTFQVVPKYNDFVITNHVLILTLFMCVSLYIAIQGSVIFNQVTTSSEKIVEEVPYFRNKTNPVQIIQDLYY